MALQHLRSSTANKRPTPAAMSDGQLAMNTNSASPGLFLKDSSGALVKVGPVHVGTTAPNASPASGGATGNTVGEQWLDTSGSTYVFKIWDGSAWRSEAGEFVNVSGDVMTGALGIIAGTAAAPGLYFSGDTNTGLWSPAADTLAASTGGSERLRITSTGLVGVGTSSAGALVHVNQTSAGDNVLRLTGSYNASGASPLIVFERVGSAVAGQLRYNDAFNAMQIGTTSAHKFDLYTGGTTALTVDSSQRVGIGTTSVPAPLSVSRSGNEGLEITPLSGNQVEIQGYNRATSNYVAALNKFSQHIWNLNSTTEAARIEGSGRLLLGTSSSSAVAPLLVVQGNASSSTGEAYINLQKGNTTVSAGTDIGYIRFADSSANLYATIAAQGDGTTGSGDYPGRLVFSVTSDGSASPTERMRIASDGAIYFQTTSTPSTSSYGTVISSGNVLLHSRNTTSAVAQFYGSSGENRLLGNGSIQNTLNSYGAISDAKLKENIEAAGSQWDDLKALEVVNFNFIGSQQRQIGLIAQQVEQVSPGLVDETPDDEEGTTTTKAVKYSVLYMKAVKALQEAMERIEALEARIAAAGI